MSRQKAIIILIGVFVLGVGLVRFFAQVTITDATNQLTANAADEYRFWAGIHASRWVTEIDHLEVDLQADGASLGRYPLTQEGLTAIHLTTGEQLTKWGSATLGGDAAACVREFTYRYHVEYSLFGFSREKESELYTMPVDRDPVVVIAGAAAETLCQGESLQLSATAVDPFGCAMAEEITWSSNNPDVAQVDAQSGLVVATAPGGAMITAAVGDSVSEPLVLHVACFDTIAIRSPGFPPTVCVGESLELEAHVPEMAECFPQTTFTWSVEGDLVSLSTDEGLHTTVTGAAPGMAIVTVTGTCPGFEPVTGNVGVEVLDGTLESLSVTPGEAVTLCEGASITITASPEGECLPADVPVSWTSSDPAVASLDASAGLRVRLTGLAEGSTTIQASVAVGDGPPVTASVQVSVQAVGGTPVAIALGGAGLVQVPNSDPPVFETHLTPGETLEVQALLLTASGETACVLDACEVEWDFSHLHLNNGAFQWADDDPSGCGAPDEGPRILVEAGSSSIAIGAPFAARYGGLTSPLLLVHVD